MLVVKVELWPQGNREEALVLGEAVIVNDATGSLATGNYDVAILRSDHAGKARTAAEWLDLRLKGRQGSSLAWRKGRVEGFPRLRQGVWDLLYRALRSTVEARNT